MFEWASEAPDDLGLPIDRVSSTPQVSGPKYIRFFGPILDALRTFGGAADPKAVMEKVKGLTEVTAQELNETNKDPPISSRGTAMAGCGSSACRG